MGNENDKSSHILNASSNLLGICFIVLTSLKLLNVSKKTFIDEFVTISIVLFMCSCILSFLSIRSSVRKSGRLENIADYVFLAGLFLLFFIAVLFSFDLIA